MRNEEACNRWLDVTQLVDTAYGLALLANYNCADGLCRPAELEAAQAAPMDAAARLLKQAVDLLPSLEPRAGEST